MVQATLRTSINVKDIELIKALVDEGYTKGIIETEWDGKQYQELLVDGDSDTLLDQIDNLINSDSVLYAMIYKG